VAHAALAAVDPVALAAVDPVALAALAAVDPVALAAVDPVALAAVDPVHLAAVHPVPLAAVHPVPLAAVHPVPLAAVHPVPLAAVHPVPLAAVHPVPLRVAALLHLAQEDDFWLISQAISPLLAQFISASPHHQCSRPHAALRALVVSVQLELEDVKLEHRFRAISLELPRMGCLSSKTMTLLKRLTNAVAT